MSKQKEEALKLFDGGRYGLAAQLMLPLAEAGDIEVQAALGAIYQNGCDTPRDLEKAVYWLEKAALGGSGLAAWNLSTLYMTCAPDWEINPEKSDMWRKRAEELGTSPFSVSSHSP